MKYREFVKQIWDAVEECPDNWRKGQKVFNVIEALYGDVARQVQFINQVDCFYDDKQIEPFIDQCWIRVFSKEHPIPPREEETVDLEKEINEWITPSNPSIEPKKETISGELYINCIIATAKHFYELGLKARKED